MTGTTPADVRVYLLTYRRNHLLRRALASLLAQTHANWICELHNDDPADAFPRQLVETINDPRVTYVHHERNLGPTPTFNLGLKPVAEPFVTYLEDDNWWEPQYLSRMLAAMARHPHVHLGWVNMWLWEETPEGKWEKQGTIWPVGGADVELIETPDPRQACAAIHSQGAMLLRVSPVTTVAVPESLPVFAIETARERVYPGPFLLLPEPLANFAITRQTWRAESADENMQVVVLLVEAFLAHSTFSPSFYRQMWAACRGSLGHKQRSVIVGAILAGRLGHVLRGARPRDLLVVAAWALRHPLRFANLFRARHRFPDVAAFLESASYRAGSHGR